jgi:hypothetical protein
MISKFLVDWNIVPKKTAILINNPPARIKTGQTPADGLVSENSFD